MLSSFRDLRHFEVDGTDGRVGRLTDLLFDDRDRRVRYLVVDTGGFLTPHPVLLGPELVERVASQERTVSMGVTRERIANSPPVQNHPPVSRRREDALRAYFGLPPLPAPATPDVDVRGEPLPQPKPEPVEETREAVEDEGYDPHLRSARAWLGYGVEGTDGHLGEVDDLLVEPADGWLVRHLVVDTGRWLFGERRVVAGDRIRGISHDARHVRIDLDRERLRETPAFESAEALNSGA